MEYVVNIEKKSINYLHNLPTGHLLALKKIFEPQGYEFKEVLNIKVNTVFAYKEPEEMIGTKHKTFTVHASIEGKSTFEQAMLDMMTNETKKHYEYPKVPEECFKQDYTDPIHPIHPVNQHETLKEYTDRMNSMQPK
jgi:hypothetical protein